LPSRTGIAPLLAAAKGAPRSGSTLSRAASEPFYPGAVPAVFSCCGAERRLLGRGTRLWSLGSAWPLRASPHDDALALPTKRPRRGTLPSRYPLVGAVSVCAPLSPGPLPWPLSSHSLTGKRAARESISLQRPCNARSVRPAPGSRIVLQRARQIALDPKESRQGRQAHGCIPAGNRPARPSRKPPAGSLPTPPRIVRR